MHTYGPNMNRFIALKMAKDAVPNGGGMEDAVKFILTPGSLMAGWKSASEWCDAAIKAVRNAGDPNPFREASEEEICEHLLAKIAERENQNRRVK